MKSVPIDIDRPLIASPASQSSGLDSEADLGSGSKRTSERSTDLALLLSPPAPPSGRRWRICFRQKHQTQRVFGTPDDFAAANDLAILRHVQINGIRNVTLSATNHLDAAFRNIADAA